MKVSTATAERGHEYYIENKVRYICVDGTKGYAIVKGSEAYEAEFEYRIYQQLIPTLESHWKQVINLCDSAKYFEKTVKVAWGE